MMFAKSILVALSIAVAAAQTPVTISGVGTKVDRCFAPQLFEGTSRRYSEDFVLASEFKVRFKYHAVPEDGIESDHLFHVSANDGGTWFRVLAEAGGRLRWEILKEFSVLASGSTPAAVKIAGGVYDVEFHVNGAQAVDHAVDLYVDGELLSSVDYYYPIPLEYLTGAFVGLRNQYSAAKGVVCDVEVENIVTFAPPVPATPSCSYCEDSFWSNGPVCQNDPEQKNWSTCQRACQEGVLEEQLYCGGGHCNFDDCIVPNSTL